MKKIYSNIIPWKGFLAMTVWPFMFIRRDYRWQFNATDENHETIHAHQQKEMLPVGLALSVVLFLTGCGWWSLLAIPLFFWWYIIEWIVRIPINGFDTHKAYRAISFEQEAYFFQGDFYYLKRRSRFLWTRYLFKNYNNT